MINYGGEIGYNCVKVFFLIYLHHNGELHPFLQKLASEFEGAVSNEAN